MPDPFRPARAAALGVALALGFAAPPAAAEGASFSFSIAGIKIGEMRLEAEQSGGGYTAKSRLETAGVVGMLTDFYFDGQASGSIGHDGQVVPDRFAAVSKSPRALRHTEIDWRDGKPVRVSVEPPRSSAPEPALQGGTLDPVSAGFRLFREMPVAAICSTTVDVFDGSRRSRLKLGKPVAEGAELACDGTFARIEGEAHSMADLREFPFRLVYSQDGGVARIERIEAPTNFGRAVIERRG